MRALKAIFAVAVLLFLIAAAADTQQKQMLDSEYMARALSAAPKLLRKEQQSFVWRKTKASAHSAKEITGLRA
jgi:hypothetical protein